MDQTPMDIMTEKAIKEATQPLQQQINDLKKELKTLQTAKPTGLALPKGLSCRAVRITREAIHPMVEATDLDQDGVVGFDEVVAFAQKQGPMWQGEKIGILLQFNYPDKKTPVATAKKGGK